MTLPAMKRTPLIGLSVTLPMNIRRGTFGARATCGWWLCKHEDGAHHVLYCSLRVMHEGECVWQRPVPEMPE